MKKLLLSILFLFAGQAQSPANFVPVAAITVAASAVGGCGGAPNWTYYDYNDVNGTIWIYAGVTTIPTLPADANKVTLAGFNFPAWIVPRANSEARTFVQRAAECNEPISSMKIIIPPDCNEQLVTSLGDPNTFYLYRLALDYAQPKFGRFTGQVRIMDNAGTSEIDVTMIFNKKGVRFFVKPHE